MDKNREWHHASPTRHDGTGPCIRNHCEQAGHRSVLAAGEHHHATQRRRPGSQGHRQLVHVVVRKLTIAAIRKRRISNAGHTNLSGHLHRRVAEQLTHNIAAPTSIAVFVGYTHPFKTDSALWGQATEILSFTDYENNFGGLYTSGVIESHVAYAVNQFFLNGGSKRYIAALQPSYYDSSGNNQGLVVRPGL